MKFEDIPIPMITIRMKPIQGNIASIKEEPVFSLDVSPAIPNAFVLRTKDSLITVKTIDEVDARYLRNELFGGQSFLAQMLNVAQDHTFDLQFISFVGNILEMGNIDIGVDEYVSEAISQIDRSVKNVYSFLNERCCFKQEDNYYFFLMAGPAIDKFIQTNNKGNDTEAQSEDDEDDDSDSLSDGESSAEDKGKEKEGNFQSVEEEIPKLNNSFCVNGDGIRFVATEKKMLSSKTIFIATRLTKKPNVQDRALRLAKGRLNFVDWTKAGQIQILAKTQLGELVAGNSSYLKKWDEYGEVEGNILLDRARKIGVIDYGHLSQNRDGTCSVIVTKASDSALSALASNQVETLELAPDELPSYLKNPGMTFTEFSREVISKAETDEFFQRNSDQDSGAVHYEVDEYEPESKTLTLKIEVLPASGSLILSLAGEIVQLKRRARAREKILEGRSANPQLGLLIEERGQIAETRRPPKIEPLTSFVRNKVFKNPPTVKQEEAIRVALNTPDIALIQGPPGTGKTTVIAAILERLNELSDKRHSNRGQILLTGFQHDAVENMIERLSLNSLPVPKFGMRSGGEAEEERNAFELKMEEWCQSIAEEIRKYNPQLTEIEEENKIRNLSVQYINAPSHRLSVILVDAIVGLGAEILDSDLYERAFLLQKRLHIEEETINNPQSPQVNVIRNLRVRAESFGDDGPARANDVLNELKDELSTEDTKLLFQAANWLKSEVPPFLADLEILRKKLLIRHTAPPVFTVEKCNEDIVQLAKLAITALRVRGVSAKDKKTAALAEFLEELESNPLGMVNAVSEYSFAFAATCQQSVNKKMLIQKGIYNDSDPNNKLEYEYVIIDEAARVSPRDLMIPMVQGKKIILVGDHRQLPHILDDEVARQMEAGESGEAEAEWLKKSMFQYLFSERLKELERRDHIARTVTLDMQYRMHPTLGAFISRNFYERFNPDEKFGSGLPADVFTHNLPGTDNKPVAWLEVPSSQGRHEHSGTSWIRKSEARAISSWLQNWIESEAGQKLTFGVISFYKAQADLIKKYLHGTYDERKLKIGTVDSFQGMEFDVVFLSMVRTLPIHYTSNKEDSREIQARRLFGHLCLYNRLNVSMSRQKRLLVVVGDSSLLNGDLPKDFIPGLVDFHKLCLKEGVVLSCQ